MKQQAHVSVWYLRTDALASRSLNTLDEWLSPDERTRCHQLRFAEDRRDFIAAHALVRCALSSHGTPRPGEWRFGTCRNGKPFVKNERQHHLRFNLAHTRGLVACVMSHTHDVGVDVESLVAAPEARALAELHCSADEQRWLNSGSADDYRERLVELWTLKEACVKASGEGLARPFDTLSFNIRDIDRITLASDPDVGTFQFALSAPTPVHRLALAVRINDGAMLHLVLQEAVMNGSHLLMN